MPHLRKVGKSHVFGNGKHRKLCLVDHLGRNAAYGGMLLLVGAVSAHHDERSVDLLGILQHALFRKPFADDGIKGNIGNLAAHDAFSS